MALSEVPGICGVVVPERLTQLEPSIASMVVCVSLGRQEERKVLAVQDYIREPSLRVEI
jgi:hypothetical protein